MSDTIPAIEQGSVVISPEHVRELRALLGEVRKQQYAPATCGHNNNAAVELAGYLRAVLGPESPPHANRRPDPALASAAVARIADRASYPVAVAPWPRGTLFVWAGAEHLGAVRRRAVLIRQ